ncbi:MAG: hypothetical protein HYY81_01905 [Deltaproteobacteria bacterium]|nr:hypothetical protein [Deltaproteobacteria bacterium]
MRKELLKKAEETLLETKKQLLREIRERVKEETEGSKDEGRDTYDLASDERDREINFILNDREREKLHANGSRTKLTGSASAAARTAKARYN